MAAKAKKPTYAWRPQKGPQLDAITATWCDELFYGGARGGGKSDYLLGDFLQDVELYQSHWQGIIFRRTYPELDELIRRSHELFPNTGAEWLEGKARWQWKNGARLKFRHMETDSDAEHYRGHQYPWIGIDELDAFPTDGPYRKMRACNRWAGMHIPTKRMRAAGNPGGAGHSWIRAYFIDPNPTGYKPFEDADTKRRVMFIPARVQDNKILMERDPHYINVLRGVGSPALVKAWLEGDWNAVVGSYFTEFGLKHIIYPIDIPDHWTRFRSMDWGSAKPFVVQWHTVSDGSIARFAPNTIITYREWYGGSAANVGLKMSVADVAKGILEREEKNIEGKSAERIAYTTVDPSMFIEDGGPSHAEEMERNGVVCQPGDNKRIPGWQQIRNRLIGMDGKPAWYVVGVACPNLVRSLPLLQHDKIKAEDVDSTGDDHAGDALRYGCMSRPYTSEIIQYKQPKMLQELTYDDLLPIRRKSRQGSSYRI